MRQFFDRIRSAFVSVPARATLVLLVFVSVGIVVMGSVGYVKLDQTTEENAEIRIDRAARAAAAIATSTFQDVFSVERDETGAPIAIRLSSGVTADVLEISPAFDTLVDDIAKTNQGSANVFRFDPETGLFNRFATTLRRPDGTLAREASLGPSHAAYASLVAGRHYTGQVQVLDRFRLAYLTPIFEGQGVVGALAVDVGWVDDLMRAKHELQRTMSISTGFLLILLASAGSLFLFREFKPLRRIGWFAHRIAIGEVTDDVPYLGRNDEIGDLAAGMAQVVALQGRLEQLAYYDQLTGVINRWRFEHVLASTLGEDGSPVTPAALLLIDLDHFKEINDAFGHAAGDALIGEIARLLEGQLRPGETLARIGGDEFAIISPVRLSANELSRLAQTILQIVGEPFRLSQGEVHAGCSIGIALLPQDGGTFEDAMRNVDLALYQAKDHGRGQFSFFAEELNEAAQKRLMMARALREAIDADGLTVHFQPQVRAEDFSLYGVEALARWQDPEQGSIPPAEFIPVAEESGLMVTLGGAILKEACRVARQWLDVGFEFHRVSVNISPIQIRQPDFESVVKSALAASGLPAHRLCLEVTESLFISHAEESVLRTLDRLHRLGVWLSLDDFGTGYSSLGYLNKMPFQQLKIDRSFVSDVDQDERKANLLQGMIALGKGLGLELVVEGAETEAEVAILRSLGCDAIQGFFFCRAVPALSIQAGVDRIRRARASFPTGPTETKPAQVG